MRKLPVYIFIVFAFAGLMSCKKDGTLYKPYNDPVSLNLPDHFPEMDIPADNQLTEARVELGRKLFYDEILSLDSTIACASCHKQENAFADPRRLSEGVGDSLGKRNAPGLVNAGYVKTFFWDGRKPTIESQVVGPMEDKLEMASEINMNEQRLKEHPEYPELFMRAYQSEPSAVRIFDAVVAFERTLVSYNSPYDKYVQGDTSALTASEKRGLDIFFGEKAECFHCHGGFNFTDESFRNNGLYATSTDVGRFEVTGLASDIGKFKVPSLRNQEVMGPYMHDGSLETLEEVVDHYSSGGKGHVNQSNLVRPFTLSAREKEDLINFLKALTDQDFLTNPAFADPG